MNRIFFNRVFAQMPYSGRRQPYEGCTVSVQKKWPTLNTSDQVESTTLEKN